MRHVDLKTLNVLLSVIKYQDIALAASSLGLRPATLVYAIRKLSDISGDPIFVKSRGRLNPTSHALRVARAAALMMDCWTSILDTTASASNPCGKTIRIGFPMSIGDPAITMVLSRLVSTVRSHRIVSSLLEPGVTATEALSAGKLDCALMVDGPRMAPAELTVDAFLHTQRYVAFNGRQDRLPHWVLSADDAFPESPVRRFLHLEQPRARVTTLPSWSGQMSFWENSRGYTPILRLNAPLPNGGMPACAEIQFDAFPDTATISLLYRTSAMSSDWLPTVRSEIIAALESLGTTAVVDGPREALAA